MALFGFGKKKEEKTPVCACTSGASACESVKPAGIAGNIRSVKVLGAGCPSCHTLLKNTREAAAHMGLNAEITYVTDMTQIAAYGVMRMPALVIDEKVAVMGKVLRTADIERLFRDWSGTSASESGCSCGGACCSETKGLSILILGSGCKNCRTLEANARAALELLGNPEASVDHVTDFTEIARYGIMSTPGLVVNGKVLSAGKVLKPEEIASLLKEQN